MIFVTIGTTMPFDELFEELDRLVSEGLIDEEVICQTGQSTYEPRHCKHFKFEKGLDKYFESADLSIVHGGTGSVLQCLLQGKPFVAMVNPRSDGDHQGEFLTQLSRQVNVIWSRNVGDLADLIRAAREAEPYVFQPSARSELIDDMLSLLR